MHLSVKLFIFDMGGVLVHNAAIVSTIASHLGIDDEAFFHGAGSDPSASAEVQTSPYHLGDIGAIMRGEIDSERFWSNFSQRTGIAVSGDPWYDFFNPVLDTGTAKIISQLKANGHRVVCGTNTLEAHYRKHQERQDYAAFDMVYASHLMGIIKPDPGFWRVILEKENVQPQEAFFIDDMAENIHAAEKLGLHTHLFENFAALAAKIIK